MRILFIYPNQDKFPFPIAPIGILTLAAIIQQKGHEVAVTDLMFSTTPELDIEKDIKRFKPELIAISIRNYNNQNPINFVSYIDQIRSYVDHIRKLTEATVICGGAGFTRLPKEIFQETGVDFGIAGEAEESFPIFIEKLIEGNEIANVPGIVFRHKGRVIQEAWIPIQDLDKQPFQDVGLVNYQQYLENGGYIGIETKRGCPNSCIYCDDSLIYGKQVRTRSPKRVVDEVEFIRDKHGFRDFYFADSLFTLPTDHFEEICIEIIKRDLNIRFETETTPVGITEKNAKLLKKAGCIGVFFGIDTGSPKMLKVLGKSFTQKDIKEAAQALSRANLPYAVCINLGGPGETMETFAETISLLKTLPDYSAVFFGLGFKIEKGSPLEDIAIRKGVISKGIDFIREGMYFAKGFDVAFLKEINKLCSENVGWVELHPEETGQVNDVIEVLKKFGKRSKIKPGWLRTKDFFPLRRSLNELCV